MIVWKQLSFKGWKFKMTVITTTMVKDVLDRLMQMNILSKAEALRIYNGFIMNLDYK